MKVLRRLVVRVPEDGKTVKQSAYKALTEKKILYDFYELDAGSWKADIPTVQRLDKELIEDLKVETEAVRQMSIDILLKMQEASLRDNSGHSQKLRQDAALLKQRIQNGEPHVLSSVLLVENSEIITADMTETLWDMVSGDMESYRVVNLECHI